jgi:hypothetical protein
VRVSDKLLQINGQFIAAESIADAAKSFER